MRSVDEWRTLYRQAGFDAVDVQSVESEGITLEGTPTKRYTIRISVGR